MRKNIVYIYWLKNLIINSPIFQINLELAGNGAPTSYQLGKD